MWFRNELSSLAEVSLYIAIKRKRWTCSWLRRGQKWVQNFGQQLDGSHIASNSDICKFYRLGRRLTSHPGRPLFWSDETSWEIGVDGKIVPLHRLIKKWAFGVCINASMYSWKLGFPVWGLAGPDTVCFSRSVARSWRVISPRNVSVKLVAVLFRIRGVPNWNLNPEAVYPFRGFKTILPLRARGLVATSNWIRTSSFHIFSSSLLFLSLDAMRTDLLTALLN